MNESGRGFLSRNLINILTQKLIVLINKYHLVFFIILLFFATQLIVNLQPLDRDMYYHIQLGNIISHQGLINHDVLSQASSNRYWSPPEWLFQVLIYKFTAIFGFASFRLFIVIFAVLQVLSIYFLSRRILNVNKLFSIFLSFFYLFITYDQFVGRPQIIVNTFFIIEMYLILLYILKNKNFLYLLLPITYIWTNMHGSVIFSPLLCLAYSLICFINYYIYKKQDNLWIKKARMLIIFSVGAGILSILPPQGLVSYQQDLILFQARTLVGHLVTEWIPLFSTPGNFIFYTVVISIPLLILLFLAFRSKSFTKLTWIIPLILLMFYGYSAFRNTIYGYIGITIIMGLLFSQVDIARIRQAIKVIFYCCLIAILGFAVWAMQDRITNTLQSYYPANAVNFIQKENIKGNMFNQYDYGGYLGYSLYPNRKIFIDGRTDVFFCCELPDYYSLTNIALPDKQYDKLLNQVFDKYNISYVVLVTEKDNFGIKIASTLITDPKWSLVFWDDTSEIFVKNDRLNSNLLNKYKTNVAIPLANPGYKKGLENEALSDYERMSYIQDSALTRNQMGVILFNQGKIQQAIDEYNKAIQLNKEYTYAYFNLAGIRMTQGKYQDAISLLKQAVILSPENGLIYFQLCKAYVAVNDRADAVNILQQGNNSATVNDRQKQIFNDLIQKIQASY